MSAHSPRAGRPLNAPGVVARLLDGGGYNGAAFDADRWLERLRLHQAEAEEAGVFDAPTYIVEGEMFLGREQLPWIGTLLGSGDADG